MANRYKYENQETLTSWLNYNMSSRGTYTDQTDKYYDMLIKLDSRIKNIHDHSYGIDNLNSDNIHVATNEFDKIEKIMFNDENIVPYNIKSNDLYSSFEEVKKQNLYAAGIIALNAYTGYNEWNLNFVKENFSNGISILFPEELVGYYNIVLTRGSNIYLNQYLKAKSEREINQLQTEIGNEGISKGNTLKKSPGFSALEDRADYTNMNENINANAAFMRLYFFPVLMLSMLSILIPLLAVIATRG